MTDDVLRLLDTGAGYPDAVLELPDGFDPSIGPAVLSGIETSPGHLKASVESREGSIIVFQESTAPGWRARVDGEPAPRFPANCLFQAVQVPAGRHLVELTYEPQSWRLGVAVSCLGVSGLLVGLFLVRRRGA